MRRIAVFARTDRREAVEVAAKLYCMLSEAEVDVRLDASLYPYLGDSYRYTDLRFASDYDGVVVIGGDGTLLQAARLLGCRPPVLFPVRVGRRGFYFRYSIHALEELVESITTGSFCRDVFRRLIGRYRSRSGVEKPLPPALNDIAVTALGSKTIRVRVSAVHGYFNANFEGDGIVVATPQGTRAYIRSAGGPLVDVEAVVVGVLNPMPTVNPRFYVLPPRPGVEVEVVGGRYAARVVVDGATLARAPPGSTVRVDGLGCEVHIAVPRRPGRRGLAAPSTSWMLRLC